MITPPAGNIVPDFDYSNDHLLACIKWAFDNGFVDGDIESYDHFTAWLDSLPQDDWSWFIDMDMPFYIKNTIVPWINDSLPLGFSAVWDWDNGIVIEYKED